MWLEYTYRQEGANFHLKEGSALVAIITYPGTVKNVEGATNALAWFLRQTKIWGWRVSHG